MSCDPKCRSRHLSNKNKIKVVVYFNSQGLLLCDRCTKSVSITICTPPEKQEANCFPHAQTKVLRPLRRISAIVLVKQRSLVSLLSFVGKIDDAQHAELNRAVIRSLQVPNISVSFDDFEN